MNFATNEQPYRLLREKIKLFTKMRAGTIKKLFILLVILVMIKSLYNFVHNQNESNFQELKDVKKMLERSTTKPSYEQPKRSYEQPKRSYEQPKRSYEQPKRSYEQPKRSYEQPKRSYEQPKRSYEQPKRSYEQPKRSYEQPKRSYEQPKRSYEQPKRSYEQPKRFYEQPKRSYEQPKRSYEQPKRSYEQPKRSYEQPKSRDTKPTNIEVINIGDITKKCSANILFMVTSHSIRADRRQSIRKNWGNESRFATKFKNITYKVFFITGLPKDLTQINEESKLYGDVFITNHTESYSDTSRVMLGMIGRWKTASTIITSRQMMMFL